MSGHLGNFPLLKTFTSHFRSFYSHFMSSNLSGQPWVIHIGDSKIENEHRGRYMGGLLSVGCWTEAKNRWGFLGQPASWPQAPQKENSTGGICPPERTKAPTFVILFAPQQKLKVTVNLVFSKCHNSHRQALTPSHPQTIYQRFSLWVNSLS